MPTVETGLARGVKESMFKQDSKKGECSVLATTFALNEYWCLLWKLG